MKISNHLMALMFSGVIVGLAGNAGFGHIYEKKIVPYEGQVGCPLSTTDGNYLFLFRNQPDDSPPKVSAQGEGERADMQ